MRLPTLPLAALLATSVVAPFAPFALAAHEGGCVPGEWSTASYPYGVVLSTDPAGLGATERVLYVSFLLPVTDGPLFDLWIYEESNGLPGLQRGDEIIQTETCGHPADTIIL